MKRVIVGFLVISFSLLIKSCDTTDPPDNKSLTLKLEDVSCTEAWIKLTTANIQIPATVTLKQSDPIGNTTSQILNLNTQDSLLYIDSLLPNQTYKFQSVTQSINQSSNELSVTTMDTTSHNFSFETFAFGGTAGSSILYDVAIVGEEIWAVGEIYVADTSINSYTTYNAVHWDGNEWILKRIKTNACGGVDYPPVKAIFAFSSTDILFAHIDGSISHYDGIKFTNDCSLITQLNGSVNKMWGKSNNDLYVVSGNGFIAHYQNWQWSRITSGTDVDLKDIYGTPDGKELWTCGWSNQNGRVAILEINGNDVESIWDSQTNTTLDIYRGLLLNTLCANGNKEFLFATGVVIRHSLIDKRIVRYEWVHYLNGQKVLELGNYAYNIRSSNKNNIIVAGDAAMIWHFNGKSWHKFEEIYNKDDRIYGLSVQENVIVAVGKRYGTGLGNALLIVGRR